MMGGHGLKVFRITIGQNHRHRHACRHSEGIVFSLGNLIVALYFANEVNKEGHFPMALLDMILKPIPTAVDISKFRLFWHNEDGLMFFSVKNKISTGIKGQ